MLSVFDEELAEFVAQRRFDDTPQHAGTIADEERLEERVGNYQALDSSEQKAFRNLCRLIIDLNLLPYPEAGVMPLSDAAANGLL